MYRSHQEEQEFRAEARARLQKLTVPELQAELDRVSREELIKQIQAAPETINNVVLSGISALVCSSMGFRQDSYNKFEVDHTNGNKFQLATQIGQYAMEAVQLCLPDFLAKLMANEENVREKLNDAMFKEYENKVNDKLRQKLWDFVNKEAERRALLMARMTLPVELQGR